MHDDIINFSVPSIDGVKINRYTVWNAGNFTNLNQLTTRNFNDLQNKPTTLSGYGITDALLASNYTADDVLTKIKTVDGSGSGLDADLLDGLDSTFFRKRYNATIQSGTWSRILYATPIALSGSFMISIQHTRDSVVVGNVFLVTFGHSGHGQITALGTHGFTQIGVRLTGDANNIYFEVKDNGWGVLGTTQITQITLDNINANVTTYADFNDGTTLIGSVKSEVITENNRINVDGNAVAYLTDNVASATKLSTSRLIWGQTDVDGTGNISGNLTGVGSIAASGAIQVSKNGGALYFGIRNQSYIGSNDGSDSYFWNTEGDAIKFGTGDSERMRIFAAGNVAIGTTADSGYKLNVAGTLNVNGTATLKDVQVAYDKKIGIEYSTTDRTMYNYFYGNQLFHLSVGNWTNSTSTKVFSIDTPLTNALSIWNNGAAEFSNVVSASRFYAGYDSAIPNSINCSGWFRSNGNTGWYNDTYGGGINMVDSTYVRVVNKAFKVNSTASDSINTDGGVLAAGNITAQGELTAYVASDRKLKKNIKPIDNALDVINKLEAVSYNWNSKAKKLNENKTEQKDFGLIAQDVEGIIPEIVHNIHNDKYKAIDYIKLIPFLIKSVQELSEKVEKQQEIIKQLQNN